MSGSLRGSCGVDQLTRRVAWSPACALAILMVAPMQSGSAQDTDQEAPPAVPEVVEIAEAEAAEEVEEVDVEEAEVEESDGASDSSGSNFLGDIIGRMFGLGGDDSQDGGVQEEISPILGQPAPDFELQTLDGDTLKLADLNGQIVVLEFWATFCDSCLRNLPELEALHQQLDEDVQIIGVNWAEEAEHVQGFVEENGLTFTQVLDAKEEVVKRYHVREIPQLIVIGPDGVVQAVHVGFSPTLGETLAAEIEKVQSGESLFDAEQIAAAREMRQELAKEQTQGIAPVHEDRIVVAGYIDAGGPGSGDPESGDSENGDPEIGEEAMLYAGSGNVRILLPGGGQATVADIGLNRILVLADGAAPEVVQLEWPLEDEFLQFYAIVSADELQWLAIGDSYDENYEATHSVLGLYERNGAEISTIQLPKIGEYSSANLATGDVTGDGKPEVLLLSEHFGLDPAVGETGDLRVLTIYDGEGILVARKWLTGAGGGGVFVISGEEGPEVLVNHEGKLARLRVTIAE